MTTPGRASSEQAEHVAEFYTVLFSHPAVEAITWWDFTDQDAWQQAPAGLVRSDMSAEARLRAAARFDQGQVVDQGGNADRGGSDESHSRDSSAATRSRPSQGDRRLDRQVRP